MRVLDFITESNEASTKNELYRLIEKAAGSMGFDRYVYGALVGYDQECKSDVCPPAVALNYPQSWIDHYNEQCYLKIDPIVQYSPEISNPFKWSDLVDRIELTRRQRRFFNEAAEAKVCGGVTVPLHGPFGKVAVMCFAASAPNRVSDSQLGYLKAISAQFQMVHECLDVDGQHKLTQGLSQREIDCLSWAALGKSSWEISVILGISENTVNYHIKNAMKKFQTNSRIVAIVKAIRQNVLSL